MYIKSPLLSVVKLFRKSMFLHALLILMFLVDVLAVFLAPVWVLVLFLILHVVIFGLYVSARCQFMNELLKDCLGVEG